MIPDPTMLIKNLKRKDHVPVDIQGFLTSSRIVIGKYSKSLFMTTLLLLISGIIVFLNHKLLFNILSN